MNDNKTGSCLGYAVLLFMIIGFFSLLGSCGSDSYDNEYRQNLENGKKKLIMGQPMTEDEYKAVEDYGEWMDDQKKEKTYDQWDSDN